MPTKFGDFTLEDALNRAIRNAKHLRARDAATVAAARSLARKIDAWDVIVEWALEDAEDMDRRPAVPQNDNVSLASFLKYMQTLQLVPPETASVSKKNGTKDEPKSALDSFREKNMRVV